MFTYDPITTDSNFEPIAVEIRRNGQPVSVAGLTGTITVRDETTHALIVDKKPTTLSLGRAEYYFSPAEVARITKPGTWLVEWRILDAANSREARLPTAKLPVLPKL